MRPSREPRRGEYDHTAHFEFLVRGHSQPPMISRAAVGARSRGVIMRERLFLWTRFCGAAAVILSVALHVAGCGTTLSRVYPDPDLPRVYSGTALDISGLSADNLGFFLLIDLPLSITADTVLLPLTVPEHFFSGQNKILPYRPFFCCGKHKPIE